MDDRLNNAFKALRKQGFLAKQNFSCCGSCAGYELANIASDNTDKGKPPRGAVYYHRQEGARFKRDGERWLALGYGQLDTTKHGAIGLPTVEVGKAAKEALEAEGLRVEWDGKEESKIFVHFR